MYSPCLVTCGVVLLPARCVVLLVVQLLACLAAPSGRCSSLLSCPRAACRLLHLPTQPPTLPIPLSPERLHSLPHRALRRQPHLCLRRCLPRLWLCAKGGARGLVMCVQLCALAASGWRQLHLWSQAAQSSPRQLLPVYDELPLIPHYDPTMAQHTPPQVPMDEALKRTLRHFSHLHASKQKEG